MLCLSPPLSLPLLPPPSLFLPLSLFNSIFSWKQKYLKLQSWVMHKHVEYNKNTTKRRCAIILKHPLRHTHSSTHRHTRAHTHVCVYIYIYFLDTHYRYKLLSMAMVNLIILNGQKRRRYYETRLIVVKRWYRIYNASSPVTLKR